MTAHSRTVRGERHHVAILLGGECTPTPRLLRHLRDARAIAADGGIVHAAPLGFSGNRAPVLWVGDFDSTSDAARGEWAAIPRETHPVAKDATDGAIAVEAALDRSAGRITLVGAFGGPRLDHSLGTTMMGIALAMRGIGVRMTDGLRWAEPLLPGEATIEAERGEVLSIVALDDLAGLSIDGAQWPLENASVPFGDTRTLSNSFVQGTVRLGLRSGRALVVTGPPDRTG